MSGRGHRNVPASPAGQWKQPTRPQYTGRSNIGMMGAPRPMKQARLDNNISFAQTPSFNPRHTGMSSIKGPSANPAVLPHSVSTQRGSQHIQPPNCTATSAQSYNGRDPGCWAQQPGPATSASSQSGWNGMEQQSYGNRWDRPEPTNPGYWGQPGPMYPQGGPPAPWNSTWSHPGGGGGAPEYSWSGQAPRGAAGFWPDSMASTPYPADPSGARVDSCRARNAEPQVGHGGYTTGGASRYDLSAATSKPDHQSGAGDAIASVPRAARPEQLLTDTRVLSVPLRRVAALPSKQGRWLQLVSQLDGPVSGQLPRREFTLRDPDGSCQLCVYYALPLDMTSDLQPSRWVRCVGKPDQRGLFVCVSVRTAAKRDIGLHRQMCKAAEAAGQ